jgi:hypothetical protein
MSGPVLATCVCLHCVRERKKTSSNRDRPKRREQPAPVAAASVPAAEKEHASLLRAVFVCLARVWPSVSAEETAGKQVTTWTDVWGAACEVAHRVFRVGRACLHRCLDQAEGEAPASHSANTTPVDTKGLPGCVPCSAACAPKSPWDWQAVSAPSKRPSRMSLDFCSGPWSMAFHGWYSPPCDPATLRLMSL